MSAVHCSTSHTGTPNTVLFKQGCFYGNWTRLLGPGVSLLRAPTVGILFRSFSHSNMQRVAVGARDGDNLGAPKLFSNIE